MRKSLLRNRRLPLLPHESRTAQTALLYTRTGRRDESMAPVSRRTPSRSPGQGLWAKLGRYAREACRGGFSSTEDMIWWYSIALCFGALMGCAVSPMFNSAGGHEEGHEIPCPNGAGGYVANWHRCHRSLECCPDGTSCGEDDFVQLGGVCRSW
jgi:hypothetical protein